MLTTVTVSKHVLWPQEEIAKLNKEIEDRHAAELAALDAQPAAATPQQGAGEPAGTADSAAADMADLSLAADAGAKVG